MAAPNQADTDELIHRATEGDDLARQALLEKHRKRLKRMIEVRIDPRIATRVDPSDVVQDTLITAARRLDDYMIERPVAYYPWLRQLAWEKLMDIHRRHLAQKRTVRRERAITPEISDASIRFLANQFPASLTSPSRRLVRDELEQRVKQILKEMDPVDREIVVLRHLEGLSVAEVAAVLQIPEGTVKRRHFNAIKSIREIVARE